MNGNLLVSIILPTYNVEKYLLQCLQSISAQTYKNIEVIIVIDGATDKSQEIAEEYCLTDKRFSVYWQENAGSGPARNLGLSKANGEFVAFIDPDDFVDADYIEQLLLCQQKTDADFVTCHCRTIVLSSKGKILKVRIKPMKDEVIEGKEHVREEYLRLVQSGLVGGPHCKLYRRRIIVDNDVAFPDLRRSQDIVFNLRYYSYIEKICVSSYIGYNYRVICDERLKRIKPDYYKTVLYIHQLYKNIFNKWNIKYDEHILCNISFARLQGWIERCSVFKGSINILFEDINLRQIVNNAKPQKALSIFIRRMILSKNKIVLKMTFVIKHAFRRALRMV